MPRLKGVSRSAVLLAVVRRRRNRGSEPLGSDSCTALAQLRARHLAEAVLNERE